jgi:hypothetical protein
VRRAGRGRRLAVRQQLEGRWSDGERRITVCYLDAAPLEVAEALRPLLDDRWRDAPVRPIHAGPYETVVPYQWDWFDG